ncbi:uncharacterized protein BDW47DRAFT_106982 [Aspergillus candidus]|uniref:Uncharacterized protein n=1 Tax=Aspergillus candidus TaxID=41067 RepID=A0A2I2F9U5_ASPCN|nr:hypothetical protein BDW47DRAFT_106982 [Aspergillus candidus]PLB37403.1 hypothetical protein BDW47DRAFT_106982 [Aspergillus candidus]
MTHNRRSRPDDGSLNPRSNRAPIVLPTGGFCQLCLLCFLYGRVVVADRILKVVGKWKQNDG